MKILVDARSLMNSPRGIGQFLLNALEALNSVRPEWQFILAANKPFHLEAMSRVQKMSNVQLDIDTRITRSIIWFLLIFKYLVRKHKVDIVWYPATEAPFFKAKRCKTLVTVHDVVCKEFQGTMSLKNRIVTNLLFDRSICAADMLWTVSNYTKEMVEKYFPKRKAKNIVVGSSINTNFFRKINISDSRIANIRKRYQISELSKILLFVGTLEPRKNLRYLLSLMPELAKNEVELIIVGGKGWGNTNIGKIINSVGFPKDRVHFAGYLTDFELLELYNVCDCYVSTSLNEGFGMPQLEALFCDAPIVTANNSAMSEVIAGVGTVIDGWDTKEWINAILNSVKKLDIRDYERKRSEYSWSLIAEQIALHVEHHSKICSNS